MKRLVLLAASCLVLLVVHPSSADEGQWPLSMIDRLDLKKAGLEIDAGEIWNPDAPSLVDAICRVGGATGSFVSAEGLILTNHHVAFNGVQAASTPARNYLEDGFVAATRADEIQARGYVCRITVGYRDVTAEVLGAAKGEMTPAERTRAVRARRAEIARDAKAETGHEAEVSEMFLGKSYVLFLYTTIQDVRLVCVPPRSVGEYGGETDNWVWPRHTGDFAFMRAYVGKDGKPAPHSADNVPYTPKRFLPVNAAGVSEGDFVFLLGYPGRTFRHQCADFVAFERDVRMPFFVELFDWHIRAMEAAGENDEAVALMLSPGIKGRANVLKNYRGKILGLDRLRLVAAKKAEEKDLLGWIEADAERKATYGHVLAALADYWAAEREGAMRRFALDRLSRGSTRMRIASQAAALAARAKGMERPALEAEVMRMRRQTEGLLRSFHDGVDREFFAVALARVLALPEGQGIPIVAEWLDGLGHDGGDADLAMLARLCAETSVVTDLDRLTEMVTDGSDPMESDDPFIRLAAALSPEVARARAASETRQGELAPLMALYVEAKQAWKGTDFCPDANRTLRFTHGNIRAYSPRDGMIYTPVTTLAGVVEKHTGEEPFDAPDELIELWKAGDFGRYADKTLGDVPVGILYDCDTTGGNSGSPVIDSKGRLVGVNFDRAFEATINDFEWSPVWSRSIGVDVRYVLWVTEKLMKAKRVIEELGVE